MVYTDFRRLSSGTSDQKADSAEDSYEWDVYPHNIENVYLRYSTIDNPLPASDQDNLDRIALINAGGFNRAMYILTDYEFSFSELYSPVKIVGDDKFLHYGEARIFSGAAIKRQTEFIANWNCDYDLNSCYVQRSPGFYKFRGSNMWWGAGTIFINNGYPTNDCPLSQLNPPSPSTPATLQSQPQEGVTVNEPVYGEPRFITLPR